MNDLVVVVRRKLLEIHPRVYFDTAPDDAVFPYVVFNFPNDFTIEELEVFNLDVDVWDRPVDGDTNEIDAVSSGIWRGLHKCRYMDNNIQFSVYRANRLMPDDDDPLIRRRKLIFELRYFDRRLNSE